MTLRFKYMMAYGTCMIAMLMKIIYFNLLLLSLKFGAAFKRVTTRNLRHSRWKKHGSFSPKAWQSRREAIYETELAGEYASAEKR